MTHRRGLLDSPWRDPLIVTVSAILALVAMGSGAPPPIRGPLTMWFFLTGPGLALAPLFRIEALKWVGVIAGSLTIDVVTTELMLYTDTWSLALGVILVMGVAGIGVAFQVRRILAVLPEGELVDKLGPAPTELADEDRMTAVDRLLRGEV